MALKPLNLFPLPRSVKPGAGSFDLPERGALEIAPAFPKDVAAAVTARLQSAAKVAGVEIMIGKSPAPVIRCLHKAASYPSPEYYTLEIESHGITITSPKPAGLRAAVATVRQLLREFGRRLPCLGIRDWPDFHRRGFMLDISRGRVPNLQTLLDLADHLADFKINELQLYTEHTFAYGKYKPVWQSWGALTGAEIRKLDAHCRRLGIDLVPNQNSFGHLREFLAYPPLKPLGEVSEPYEGANGEFLRYPSTLAPNHPGTLPFVCGLFDELLPNFSSRFFNVGCDETWDLGRGQSKAACDRLGKGRVYVNFLKKIHRAVKQRGRLMMFWGDIILNHPELIPDLPKDVIALNWGYEADHPFPKETAMFRKAGVRFYVCPGTSTWMTLIGKHDNGFTNLQCAAEAGRKNRAIGYLITDWGDGGHPQPLAVSWPLIAAGAALSWCGKSYREEQLAPALSRELFEDRSRTVASAALALGVAHKQLKYTALNETPLGTAITAPPPEQRELFCRNGLKHFAKIPGKNIGTALAEIEKQLRRLERVKPTGPGGAMLLQELKFAARMAVLSCQYMLWQQARTAGESKVAGKLSGVMTTELRKLDREFNAYWPKRNKATPKHCTAFIGWRLADLRAGTS